MCSSPGTTNFCTGWLWWLSDCTSQGMGMHQNSQCTGKPAQQCTMNHSQSEVSSAVEAALECAPPGLWPGSEAVVLPCPFMALNMNTHTHTLTDKQGSPQTNHAHVHMYTAHIAHVSPAAILYLAARFGICFSKFEICVLIQCPSPRPATQVYSWSSHATLTSYQRCNACPKNA